MERQPEALVWIGLYVVIEKDMAQRKADAVRQADEIGSSGKLSFPADCHSVAVSAATASFHSIAADFLSRYFACFVGKKQPYR